MNVRARLSLLLFALIGLGSSSASATVHYRLLRDPGYTSFCDINATVSCTEAYLSPWGSVFGVPVALLGVFWFGVAAALLVAERVARPQVRDGIPGYLFAWSTVGLAFVLYLAYGAFFVLKAVCVLCVLTYVAVIGIFLVSGAVSRVPMSTLPVRAARDLRTASTSPLALIVFVVFIAGAATAIAFFPRESAAASGGASQQATPATSLTEDKRTEVEKWFDSLPRAIVPVDPAGARVLVVKFNDYQCPPCRQTYEQYKPILGRYQSQYPGQVKFVVKDFPLDSECNMSTPRVVHEAGCEAAAAVRLARAEHGDAAASRMEEWLFANQQALNPAMVRQGALEVGGVKDFDGRYASILQAVKTDTALGGLLGVHSTPTFFINGVKVDPLLPEFFDAIIAYELKKTGK